MGTENHSKPGFGRFTVRYVAGKGYAAFSPDGVPCSAYQASKDQAENVCDWKQRQADAAAKRKDRPCLCCGTVFASEGIHNRMCNPCRARTSNDEALPFSFGAIHGRKRA